MVEAKYIEATWSAWTLINIEEVEKDCSIKWEDVKEFRGYVFIVLSALL